MRLALLSNVTVELLAPQLEAGNDLWMASGFGAWTETLLDPSSGLADFRPEAVVLLLDRSRVPVDERSRLAALASWRERFPAVPVVEIPLAQLAEETPGFYDERLWTLARMPWSAAGLKAIAEEVRQALALKFGGARKALALDLDGTLWRGVIGEDGVKGVEPYAEFQAELKRLRERGILLTLLSHNNPEDVLPVWSDSRMRLQPSDFVGQRLDWNDKADNLTDLSRELNLGLDAWVFVDDNPVERLAMSARHPEVAVPEFPVAAAELPRWLRRLERRYFPELDLTPEDRMRTQAYQAETERREIKSLLDFDDYLKALDIRVDFHELQPAEMARVAQLSVKTHQFNVNPHRYSETDVAALAGDPMRRFYTVRTSDRFGDLGLVAFVQVALSSPRAEIVDWVMSCRAMNRRIEFTIERLLEETLRRQGIVEIAATCVENAKNRPVWQLFDAFGFKSASSSPGLRTYLKSCTAPQS